MLRSFTGINIIQNREFTPDRTEKEIESDSSDRSDSGEKNENEPESRIAETRERLKDKVKDADAGDRRHCGVAIL